MVSYIKPALPDAVSRTNVLAEKLNKKCIDFWRLDAIWPGGHQLNYNPISLSIHPNVPRAILPGGEKREGGGLTPSKCGSATNDEARDWSIFRPTEAQSLTLGGEQDVLAPTN